MQTEIHRENRLSWTSIYDRVDDLIKTVSNTFPKIHYTVFGVPRGGIHVAQAIASTDSKKFTITDNIKHANIIVDDLIDSGRTREHYAAKYPEKPFYALYDKRNQDKNLGWIIFPWETEDSQTEALNAITRFMQALGMNLNSEGMAKTPERVLKFWQQRMNPSEPTLTTFPATVGTASEEPSPVIMNNISFFSLCEHHLLPFFGLVHVLYFPTTHIVGLSKIARIAEYQASKPTTQEYLNQAIAEHVMRIQGAHSCTVIIDAAHMCMSMRGVNQQTPITRTIKTISQDDRHRAEHQSFIQTMPKPNGSPYL